MITPGLTPSPSKRKAKASPRPLYKSLLIISPIIVIFFVLGIYLGSISVTNKANHGHLSSILTSMELPDAVTEGLPGTKNILTVRDKHLRPRPKSAHEDTPPVSALKNRGSTKTIDTHVEQAAVSTVTKTFGGARRRESSSVSSTSRSDNGNPTYRSSPRGNLRGQFTAVAVKSPPSVSTPHSRGSSTSPRSQFLKSFHATASSAMTATTSLDNENIVIGAWIYLDPDDNTNDKDMRTVFSNKAAGCDNHMEQFGLSLYVNAWQQHDHKLYVEYGSTQSGCHKVSSLGQVPLGQWTHVAVAMQPSSSAGEGFVALYINGELASGSSAEGAPPHEVQSTSKMTVGRYLGNAYSLEGNITHFAVVHPRQTLTQSELSGVVRRVMDVATTSSVEDLRAYFTLEEGSMEKVSSEARSSVGDSGTFTFPLRPKKRAYGLKVALLDGLEDRPKEPTEDEKRESDRLGRIHADQIKASMKSIWSNYHQYAWGRDELKPVSKRGHDNWGGMGVTLVDSLDTLWLMGLKEEFWQARDWVRDSLTFEHAATVSVFETTIRELGGLLSAYDLSSDKAFLDKARKLGDKLAPAFRTSSGVAWGMVDFHTGRGSGGWSGSSAILAELGSLQIEFRNLAEYTRQPKYEEMSMKGLKFAHAHAPANGLFPIKMDINSGHFTDNTITFGALGDSFYEYLLKVWIQGGRQETWLREMYDRAMDSVMNELLATSEPDGLVFVADLANGHQKRKMDHLVCFLPGVLALGAHTDPRGEDSPRAKRDLAVAKSLMYTCRQMYHTQVSGISPEYVEFPPNQGMKIGSTAPFYILRPETAESLFILGQLTGDPVYRTWAWEIWEAIDRHCKAPAGYGALRNVRDPHRGIDDRMESFWTAETMKYLWLAQYPEKVVDLDQYVFNTEAHPTRIFERHAPVSST